MGELRRPSGRRDRRRWRRSSPNPSGARRSPPPAPRLLRGIRRICHEYDVLPIADEVVTGFGRTGPVFAAERYDAVPDPLVIGKRLSAGYAPISGVVVRERVAEPFRVDGSGSFPHGHTYAGNPVAAAVANHVVERYTPDVLATGRERGETIRFGSQPLGSHPMVGEVRHAGAMVGVDFVADRETKEPFDPELQVYERVYDAALERGVYIYPGRALGRRRRRRPRDARTAARRLRGVRRADRSDDGRDRRRGGVVSVEYDHRRRSGRTASEAPAGSSRRTRYGPRPRFTQSAVLASSAFPEPAASSSSPRFDPSVGDRTSGTPPYEPPQATPPTRPRAGGPRRRSTRPRNPNATRIANGSESGSPRTTVPPSAPP